MKNNKTNKSVIILGLLLMSLKHIIQIPYNFACFTTGLGISLLGLGIYAMHYDMEKLKLKKKKVIKKLID